MTGSELEWIDRVPRIDLVLAGAVAIAAALAILRSSRGGRFRGLAGWAGFCVLFVALLVCLARAPRNVSFPLLGAFMFAALRSYFSVAPVRPHDRYVVLAAYLAIPFALWPAWLGAEGLFLATVPVTLFLVVPVFLSFGLDQKGLLDSMGRTLLGVLFFVFCIAHLGLLVHQPHDGALELFGLLVLAAELPQRLAGRFGKGSGWALPTLGIVISIALTVAVGWWLGPWCGLVEEDGGRAGFLVVAAATMGALVSRAVGSDLALSTTARFGRGAFMDRTVPALYAAPVFFHYLDRFV